MRLKSQSILRGAFLVFLFFVVSGCASYQDNFVKVRKNYRSGNYSEALNELDKSALAKSGSDRLLYLLEKSQILSKLGEEKKSRRLLLEASKLVDDLYTTSISKGAATFVVNESVQDYAGEDYEKVAIHSMLALSFLEEGNLQGALVEARKINNRLNEINQTYEKKNRYAEDAFARYLSGMIHEVEGNLDSAIIDYRKAVKAYGQGYSSLFNTPVPRELVQALYSLYLKRGRKSDASNLKKDYRDILAAFRPISDKLGELIVIHRVGDIAVKEKEEFMIPIGKEIVRFSFPIIRASRRVQAQRTGIKLEDSRFISAEIAQNLSMIAATTLEDRRGRTIVKAGARLILKSQITQQAAKEFGPLGQIAGNIFGAVTETADTRSWTLLPEAFLVARVALPAQKKIDAKIFTDGRLTETFDLSLKPGQIKIMVD